MLRYCRALIRLVAGLIVILGIMCLFYDVSSAITKYWRARDNRVNTISCHTVTPGPAKPPQLTCTMVQGAYSALSREYPSGFTFILFPNRIYRGYLIDPDGSPHHEWSGTWTLDSVNRRVHIDERSEGVKRCKTGCRHCKWYIKLMWKGTGELRRDGYFCHYQRLSSE